MTLPDVPHRTTLTLDDDVAATLDREVRRSGRPYRSVVNDALRRGLETGPSDPAPFRVDPQAMGVRPGIVLDDIAGVLDLLDGPTSR